VPEKLLNYSLLVALGFPIVQWLWFPGNAVVARFRADYESASPWLFDRTETDSEFVTVGRKTSKIVE
jgi:hypothetical protein